MVEVNVRQLHGNWDDGYALDKHVLSSTPNGVNSYGWTTFDTTRSEAGEALFQLKYRQDTSQESLLASEIKRSLMPRFDNVGLIVPMPASNSRQRQPVNEIARELSRITGITLFEDIIIKRPAQPGDAQLKDLKTKDEKAAALAGRFSLNDRIAGEKQWNALLVDDLYDSGASMEAACAVLRTYAKIAKIYVATVSWK